MKTLIDKDLVAQVLATTMDDSDVIDEVVRSEKGVYCLKCLQKHYPEVWTVLDNGTYYCEKHREELLKGVKP
jgi:hypothetical protein